MSRGGIRSHTVESSVVCLGNNEFETGSINVAANAIIKKGTVLKRVGEKFAPISNIETETPVAINPFDIENTSNAAADMSMRACICGNVRADLLTANGVTTTPAQNDKIRASTACIPLTVNDISHTE
jgi:hypothetical protein